MKKVLTPLALFTLLLSCNSNSKTTEEKKEHPQTVETIAQSFVNSPLLGSYVGAFGTNKITLLITKVLNDTIEGRSVVGGNDRPFSGLATLQNGMYTIKAKEPGDNKNDGEFLITFDEKDANTIKGNWKPFKEGEHGGAKDFSLTRNSFKYLTDVGLFPEASKRLLKDADVENLLKSDLEIMRNEIFARHGYCFKKKYLREQFEDKDWYIPNSVDIKDDLTEIEKKNIALIKKYEKYAEEYGNDFGR
jgi:hypothetical protein